MKSPAFLAARLRKQWQTADHREHRLLQADAWPWTLSIGKPSATEFLSQAPAVREHVQQWRGITVGEVQWEPVSYRAAGEPVEIPVNWILRNPNEWIAAANDASIALEYGVISNVLAQTDQLFAQVVIRQLRSVINAGEDIVLHSIRLATALEPGCANGRPLRALSLAGIDSKFFERNRTLIQKLLDARFDGQASEQGLEAFLGALDEGDHWLLVAPLESGLLPFDRQSVPASELQRADMPGSHLLIVENERSLHQVPKLSSTVAVLGSGLNLAWMQASWLNTKAIGYWGDIDTWGLTMLATARTQQPHLRALLMNAEVFQAHAIGSAVVEPTPAGATPPQALTPDEAALYLRLRASERGRLEQEFLPPQLVADELRRWRG
jgi:hypothetical protein